MQKNSYQIIKDFIMVKLNKIEGTIPSGKIEEEIEIIKNTAAKIGWETFAIILSVDEIIPLEDKEWERIKRELETHYNVEMKAGVLVQGTDQQLRDTTWWSSKEKQTNKNYFWNRYRGYLETSMPPNVVRTINEDTDIVMDNIENPAKFDEFSRYGMVVGHVQSGKTGNYAALLCKAADAGYKFIVVIAGGLNNLRDQTQERINASFVGSDKAGNLIGVGKLSGLRRELQPVSLTTEDQDFNKRDADRLSQGLNFDNINTPIILVIKKHSSTLKNVIKWLKSQYKNQIADHAMLLIDDEADYASINTKQEEDPTIINKKIRELLNLFNKRSYVAYTATPYANILIDHEAETVETGKDLFPSDFIYALEAPDNYFGAKKIFQKTNLKHVVEIDDYTDYLPTTHKKEWELMGIPESMLEAIRVFVINIAIRALRGQGDKHNSMLIHASRFTNMHKNIRDYVEDYLTRLTKDLVVFGKLSYAESQSDFVKDLKETWLDRHEEDDFEWIDVQVSIADIIESIIIREVHANTKIPLKYRNDVATNAIVIGGTSLSRGFTLEGLSVSYFLRNTSFYDTLMQMGRWFGYRQDYEDLCYIYMSSETVNKFISIIEATDDLIEDLKEMRRQKMTPRDFGLAVKQHPESGLQVTARNKQRNAQDVYFEMRLDGQLKETSWLSKDPTVMEENLQAIEKIIETLYNKKIQFEKPDKGKSYIWKDVNKSIIKEFLYDFKTYIYDGTGINARMPINFIREYAKDIETKWDIALYSGESENEFSSGEVSINPQMRKFNVQDDYYEIDHRQVSSGTAERIALKREVKKVVGDKRKDIRAHLEKPLLMLHVLEPKDNGDSVGGAKKVAAFGVSFPGGVSNPKQTVKYKVNTVKLQQLMNEEAEYDDEE